jgi:hypothetical protein
VLCQPGVVAVGARGESNWGGDLAASARGASEQRVHAGQGLAQPVLALGLESLAFPPGACPSSNAPPPTRSDIILSARHHRFRFPPLLLLLLFLCSLLLQELAEIHVELTAEGIHEALELARRQFKELLEAALHLLIDCLQYLLNLAPDG